LDLFQAIILAAVQGITAWIPVSSKTQVILAANALFATPFKTAVAFALLLHLGDLLAALWKYRVEYFGAIEKTLKQPLSLTKFSGVEKEDEKNFLVISIIATAVLALPLYLLLRGAFSSLSGEPLLFAVGLLLIAMAAITFYTKKSVVQQAKISLKTSVLTGLAQALAVIPGISRSGTTQSALLLQGVPPWQAVRLSFLMSAPMIAAALSAFSIVEGFKDFPLQVIAAGIAVSAIFSLLTMNFIGKIAQKIPSHYFLAAIGLLAMVPMLLKLAFGVAG